MENAINHLVEIAVERARRKGDLDNLRGAGRPIEKSSLTADPFAHVYAESGVMHPVQELQEKIAQVRSKLAETSDPDARRALQKEIAQLETRKVIEAETFRKYT